MASRLNSRVGSLRLHKDAIRKNIIELKRHFGYDVDLYLPLRNDLRTSQGVVNSQMDLGGYADESFVSGNLYNTEDVGYIYPDNPDFRLRCLITGMGFEGTRSLVLLDPFFTEDDVLWYSVDGEFDFSLDVIKKGTLLEIKLPQKDLSNVQSVDVSEGVVLCFDYYRYLVDSIIVGTGGDIHKVFYKFKLIPA